MILMDCNMSFTKYVLPLPVQPVTIIANGCTYFTPDSGADVICDVCTTAGFPCGGGGGGGGGVVPLIATNGGVGGGVPFIAAAAGGGGVPLIATSGGMGGGDLLIPLIAAASGCGVPLIAAVAGVPCVSSMF